MQAHDGGALALALDAAPAGPFGPDLRRPDHRVLLLDRLVRRAELLPADDRALINLIYAQGRHITELAHLAGRDHDGAQALRRHVRRLVGRVLSPKFEFVARHHGRWRGTRREVAVARVLHGRTRLQAAHALHLSMYTVRRHDEAIEAQFEMHRSTNQ